MSTPRSSSRHALTWTLVIVSLPFFYFLSAPWVESFGLLRKSYYSIAEKYCVPWFWLAGHDVVKRPMFQYYYWVIEMTGANPFENISS